MVLEVLGFKPNWIYEVVVETIDEDSTNRRSAMGLHYIDSTSVFFDIYIGSNTCSNLNRERSGRVYLPVSVLSFFPEGDFFGYFEFNVTNIVKKGELTRFYCTVSNLELDETKGDFRLINRAECLVLESLIALTKPGSDEDKRSRLDYYYRVVSKVAPGSEYEGMLKKLRNGGNHY